MLTRLLLVLGFLYFAAPAADAAELCNETSYVVHIATGYPVEGGAAIEGWTRVRPGECADVAEGLDLDGEQPLFFYAKTSEAYPGGVREWRGNVPLCVDEADFELVANTRCAALGLASRDFIIREGEDRDRTVLVEPDDFGRRAMNAGIQRLLQASGYSVSTIDGYIGRGTRRAISNFQRDAGLSARPADPQLVDALESMSLDRNTHAGLTVCNDSSTDIATAVGYRLNGEWQSRGWWRMHSGECARILATRLDDTNSFFYAERISSDIRGAMTGGEETFCYAPARYLAEGREDCAERGYGIARFRRIPEPTEGGVRVTITDTDFEGIRP